MPIAATAAILIAIDCIGLGMHLADADREAASVSPGQQRAQTRVTAPEAVVDSSSLTDDASAAAPATASTRLTTPSGVLIGPVAPPVVTPQPAANSGTAPTPPAAPAPAVPLAQANVGVPALGANVQAGLGEGSCTTVDLTLLALGDCPAPAVEGAVVLQLGGSLLGD